MALRGSSDGAGLAVHRRLHVVRHDSAESSWEAVHCEPAPRLRAYIEGNYQGWIERTTRVIRRREIPSPMVPMIVNLGPPFRLVDPKSPAAPSRAVSSFVAGLHESYALVESRDTSICIQVNFTPIGARLFLGVPMASLTNLVVETVDLLGKASRILVARLQDTEDWAVRFAILESFIGERILTAARSSPGVHWAWKQLEQTSGMVDIGGLANEVGCSRKHLITQFRDHLGLPPKTLARLLRFRQALRLLEENEAVRWVEIALRSGYYDQAHLIRDFREFAGCTPTEYLGRRLPDGGGLNGD